MKLGEREFLPRGLGEGLGCSQDGFGPSFLLKGLSFTLQEQEQHGKPSGKTDKRTLLRVIEQGVAAGKLSYFSCKIPAQKPRKEYACDTICRAGVDLATDQQLLKKVRSIFRASHRILHQPPISRESPLWHKFNILLVNVRVLA